MTTILTSNITLRAIDAPDTPEQHERKLFLRSDGVLCVADSTGNIMPVGTVAGSGAGVTSVNLRTGAVTLTAADVGLGNVTNDAQLKAAALDTDGTLAANSDAKIASQKAVRTYVGAQVAALLAAAPGKMVFGAGEPINSLGSDGDFYCDKFTGKFYQRQSGSYVLIGRIFTPPINQTAPALDDAISAVGVVRQVSTGAWFGYSQSFTFAYQWAQLNPDGSFHANIDGATSNTYTPQAGDVGYKVACYVTATNEAGSATQLSNLTDVVAVSALASGLFAYFPFDSDGGDPANLLCGDATGNGNDLTNNNNTTVDTSGQKFGTGAAVFDGSSTYLSAFGWDVNRDLSFSFWVKTVPGNAGNVFSFYDLNNNAFFYVYSNESGNLILGYTGSGANIYYAVNSSDGNWHHVGVIISRTFQQMVLYVDGSLYDQTNYASDAGGIGTNGFYIGCDPYFGNHFQGEIDQFRIYTRLLTGDEIAALASET